MTIERDQGQIPELVDLELSLDEIAEIAEEKGVPSQMSYGPTGLRELMLDINMARTVSGVYALIWESRNSNGSCNVRTFKDFLPAINNLLGPSGENKGARDDSR